MGFNFKVLILFYFLLLKIAKNILENFYEFTALVIKHNTNIQDNRYGMNQTRINGGKKDHKTGIRDMCEKDFVNEIKRPWLLMPMNLSITEPE